MGLGILEPSSLDHVPGTTKYFDNHDTPRVADGSIAGLKTTSDNSIILVPQPSDDPNDPLNWSLLRRDIILFLLSLVSIFATCLGSILAANTLTLSFHFERSFTKIAVLTGYLLLGTGIAAIFCVPSARVWGKRHLFLLGTVIIVFSSAWGGAAIQEKHYGAFIWARIFQGIGCAPFETLVNAAVGDLYFVHERGKRMALANLAVFGGAFFTPIVVGKITHTIGVPWTFYLVTIFSGVCLPLIFLCVPETAFRRSARFNTDLASSDDIPLYQKSSEDAAAEKNGVQPDTQNTGNQYTGANSPMKGFAERLLPVNGRISDENFWRLVFRPFPLFAHPAIFWACITQGAMIGWTVFIGVILAAIFMGRPLYWDEVQTGYAYTGAFVGAILGFIFSGFFADWSAKVLTRKNNGVYEPEFRIVLVIPQLIFGCTGLYLFGVTSANLENYSWVLPIFAFGLQIGGMIMGTVSASLYIVDAHRDIAIEAFTCTIIFKNFFAFGLTFSAYNWLIQAGAFKAFMWISSIQVLICLLSIPMYVFGKRNRAFFHRHDILRICRLT